MAKGENKAQVMHRPNWHPSISTLIGEQNIVDSYAYVTEYGTIHLLGPLYQSPNIPKLSQESNINGPTTILSAESALGF
jgi:hypothetical protein